MDRNLLQYLMIIIGGGSHRQVVSEIQRFFLEWTSGFTKPIGSAAKKKKGNWSLKDTVSAMIGALKEEDTTLVMVHVAASPFFLLCMGWNDGASRLVRHSIQRHAESIVESCASFGASVHLSYDASGAAWIMIRVKRSVWFDRDNPAFRMSIVGAQNAFCRELRELAVAYLKRKDLSEFFALHAKAIGAFGVVDFGKSLNSLRVLLDSGDIADRKYRFASHERERDFRRISEFFGVHAKARAEEFLYKNILEYLMEMQYDMKTEPLKETMKFLNMLRKFGIINRVPKKQVKELLECIADSRLAQECQYQPQNLNTAWISFLEGALLRDWHPLCSEIMDEDAFLDFFTPKTLLRLWKP